MYETSPVLYKPDGLSLEVREEERKIRFLTSLMSNGSGHNER